MGNTIQIRHGSSIPTTSDLSHSFELGYATTPGCLYINDGTSISRIGVNVLSGTSTPSSAQGQNGDFYVQYTTSGNDTTVDALYVKILNAWCESAGGSGGASVILGTTTPTAAQGEDGNLYVQYHTSGNDNVVDALYVKISGAWSQISTGGGATETVLTDTLVAGTTSLTFTDPAITTAATYRVGTTDITVRPTGAIVAAGTLTLTFASQASDLGVKVVIY